MQLFSQSGQRAAALRQYRQCVATLDQELGVAPLEETTQVYQAIRENRGASLAEPLPLHPSAQAEERAQGIQQGRASGYPMVGRSAELKGMLRAYEGIGADGHILVLEGEAGVGKTRLAQEFVAEVRARGAGTVMARCYQGETSLAYGPFSEALRAAIGSPDASKSKVEAMAPHWLSEVARLLPDLGFTHRGMEPILPLDNPGAQNRFFDGISHALMAACGGTGPGLLFLDDVHWADEASIDLLAYLVRRLEGRPQCILVTWRSEEVGPGHRLRNSLAEAQRRDFATSLSLRRLGQPAVAELVRAIAADGVTLPAGIEERLYRETEGLPFFLVEYLSSIPGHGNWDQGTDWPIPANVGGLLMSRLAAVGETGRQLLDTAAIIGRSFDFDTLQQASGRSDEETVVGLEGLIARGLVDEVRDGGAAAGLIYDFSHEQLRSLVYQETSLARRRLLHRRVAEALVTRSRGKPEAGPLASRIGQHYRDAGLDTEAAHHLIIAGDHARSLFANAEALGHYRSALDLGHSDGAGLHAAIGDIQTILGEYGAAIHSYERAAALCDPVPLSGVEGKLGGVHLRRGDWEMAESYLSAALESLGHAGMDGQRSRLLADLSLVSHHQGQSEAALDLARQAVEVAEAAADTQARAQAHNILGVLARSGGDSKLAGFHLRASLDLAERLADPSARVAALNNLALLHSGAGETVEAINLAETALKICASQGDRHREAALHNNLADLLHKSGRSEDSMSHLKQAVTIFAEIGVEAGTMQPEIWKLVEW